MGADMKYELHGKILDRHILPVILAAAKWADVLHNSGYKKESKQVKKGILALHAIGAPIGMAYPERPSNRLLHGKLVEPT